MGALIFSSLVNGVLFFRVIEQCYFGSMRALTAHSSGAATIEEGPWPLVSALVVAALLLIVLGLSSQYVINAVLAGFITN
jgi:multicomponent Na+:H+ antiporter subunit D